VLVVALCRITAFNDYHIFGTWLGSGHFPIGPLFLFILLTLFVNTILRAQKPHWQLTPAELMTLWAMLIVTAGMPDASIARYLFPTMLGVTYFATPENEWKELFHQYIPDWMIVRDQHAVNSFYEGISPGDPIPWAAWMKPLSFWIPFFLMLWAIMICLSAILRRQWAERERLGFPLVQLPVEMAQHAEDNKLLNAFFRNRMMWIGFAIPVFFHAINALHFYYPAVPEIRLRHYLDQYFYEHPLNHIRPFWLHILPSVIGISYLISLEVSFSLWFFFVLYKVEYITAAALGYASATYYRGFVPHREMGAYVALVVFFIWIGKAHFWNVLKATFSAKKQADDTNEMLPYRYATFGLFASIMGATLMLTYAGASFLSVFAVIIMLIVMWLVLSRLVIECGMLYIQHSFVADDLIMTAIGSSRLDASTLTILAFIPAVGMRDLRELMMPHLLNVFKIPELVKMNPPPAPPKRGEDRGNELQTFDARYRHRHYRRCRCDCLLAYLADVYCWRNRHGLVDAHVRAHAFFRPSRILPAISDYNRLDRTHLRHHRRRIHGFHAIHAADIFLVESSSSRFCDAHCVVHVQYLVFHLYRLVGKIYHSQTRWAEAISQYAPAFFRISVRRRIHRRDFSDYQLVCRERI
jgi:hypothetical protein